MTNRLLRTLAFLFAFCAISAFAQEKQEYALGAGDTIRVLVFQNPDLTMEARVSEGGTISFPLVGSVQVGGLAIGAAEQKIADALQQGGFVRKPQVNIVLLQIRGNQVSVLGQVNRPGRFPLETINTRVSDILAAAGGAISGSGTFAGGDDVVVVTGVRDGKAFRKEVDIPSLYVNQKSQDDILLMGGDTIFVARAPVFYIYGEAQRPGVYRVERGMSVMQALAAGGGPTSRGTDKRVRLHRKNAAGVTEQIDPKMTDPVLPNDVIYVRESLF